MKTNPRRRPINAADLKKAKTEAVDKAVEMCEIIHLTVLKDKHGFDNEMISQFYHEVEYLSDSISKGYVSLSDLKNVLRKEYGILN